MFALVGHRKAGPSPPGAASGPPDSPDSGRSCAGEIAHPHEARKRRPQGGRADSRRPRRAPSAFQALSPRLRRCCRRLDLRRPPARACGGRYVRYGPLGGPGGRPDEPATALRHRCGLRQRGKRAGVSRGRRGREAWATPRRRRRHQAAKQPYIWPHALACSVYFARARTSRERQQRAPERSAVAAMAPATTPGASLA